MNCIDDASFRDLRVGFVVAAGVLLNADALRGRQPRSIRSSAVAADVE